jgi:UDP-glucose 4-epimerase
VFGNGEQTRDYIHVDDVVRANLAAADSDALGAFNIGRCEEVSVLDLVEAFKELSTDGFEPEFAPERPGEVQRIYVDYSRARDELGWEPQVTLDQGLRSTIESIRDSR